ncbi:helix-turn-helix transcriptional regulator [Methanosarcina barkeri]|uniref:helix-turn-helix transcriptional regulator n=1 Tax=Methanosarcina barkeri TaxID=2208 RepID=UPI000A5BF138|nr:winged helix-turn-helix domain-containing protein [Methanosarcina barkeri]
MENNLLNLIFLSEKRKNVLLLLLEGPKDIETIKKTLNASATAVQPQVKKLKEQHLVVQEKNFYKLSEIGRVVVEKMKPLVDTITVLEENANYWAEREVNEVPPFLLRRISELGHCAIIEPQIDYMFELIPEYVKNARMAKELKATISYFHPLFPSFFLEIAEKGIMISLVFPESVLKRWVEDYREQTEQYLKKKKMLSFLSVRTAKRYLLS